MVVFGESMDHISRGKKKKQKSKNKTKQNCPCFLAMHSALFMGTWQKGPNAVRLDTRVWLSGQWTSVRAHLSPPLCYPSWPTLKLLPGMATWPPIFLLQKSPRKSHLVICYLKAAADIHKASANCVCRPEVVSLEAVPFFRRWRHRLHPTLGCPAPGSAEPRAAREARGLSYFQGNLQLSQPRPASEVAAAE